MIYILVTIPVALLVLWFIDIRESRKYINELQDSCEALTRLCDERNNQIETLKKQYGQLLETQKMTAKSRDLVENQVRHLDGRLRDANRDLAFALFPPVHYFNSSTQKVSCGTIKRGMKFSSILSDVTCKNCLRAKK